MDEFEFEAGGQFFFGMLEGGTLRIIDENDEELVIIQGLPPKLDNRQLSVVRDLSKEIMRLWVNLRAGG